MRTLFAQYCLSTMPDRFYGRHLDVSVGMEPGCGCTRFDMDESEKEKLMIAWADANFKKTIRLNRLIRHLLLILRPKTLTTQNTTHKKMPY